MKGMSTVPAALSLEKDMKSPLDKLLEKLGKMQVVVEGKNDEKALKEFIPSCEIITANSRRMEKIALDVRDSCVILFDFDEEGGRKALELQEHLIAQNKGFDSALRRCFNEVFKVKFVEESNTRYLELMELREKGMKKMVWERLTLTQ